MFLTALKHVSPYQDKDEGLVNVFIETPKGSQEKFDLDNKSGLLTWSLELPAGLSFPFSFGFVPNTEADDGDALDIILLLDGSIPSGTVLPVRLIGVMKARQKEEDEWVQNDRVIAVAHLSRAYSDIHDIGDLQDTLKDDIESFFKSYNKAIDRAFESNGFEGQAEAYKLLEQSID